MRSSLMAAIQQNAGECIGDGSSAALVYFIRSRFGDTFGVAVAGFSVYATSRAEIGQWSENDDLIDMQLTRASVDAGADMVLSQAFMDPEVYVRFKARCEKEGLGVPIVPSVMPIENVAQVQRCHDLTGASLPIQLVTVLTEAEAQGPATLRKVAVEWTINQIKRCHELGAPCVHIFSLNQEDLPNEIVCRVLGKELVASSGPEPEPRRRNEVRPVFWSKRAQSYMTRTAHIKQVPDGCWGRTSLEYGDFCPVLGSAAGSASDRRALWGESIANVDDVHKVFTRYLIGEISRLPWSEGALDHETSRIVAKLVWLNEQGLLTINSQPAINAIRSECPMLGWGGPGGRVYQKAYLEFFAPPEMVSTLCEVLAERKYVSFHAVDRAGRSKSNCPSVNAVTWGCFPGREIVQPTVVDPASFMVWKDEAFALWGIEWASIYPEGSPSRTVLEQIERTYWLVNIVDNNYISGDIFKLMEEVLKVHSEKDD